MVLPTTLAGVLTSGIVTALVPAYVETRDTSGRLEARRFAGRGARLDRAAPASRLDGLWSYSRAR